jgi:hypothetical protein
MFTHILPFVVRIRGQIIIQERTNTMSRKGENIRRRKDGRWEARCLVTKVSTGKKKYIYLYAKSYAEVREKNTAD